MVKVYCFESKEMQMNWKRRNWQAEHRMNPRTWHQEPDLMVALSAMMQPSKHCFNWTRMVHGQFTLSVLTMPKTFAYHIVTGMRNPVKGDGSCHGNIDKDCIRGRVSKPFGCIP